MSVERIHHEVDPSFTQSRLDLGPLVRDKHRCRFGVAQVEGGLEVDDLLRGVIHRAGRRGPEVSAFSAGQFRRFDRKAELMDQLESACAREGMVAMRVIGVEGDDKPLFRDRAYKPTDETETVWEKPLGRDLAA